MGGNPNKAGNKQFFLFWGVGEKDVTANVGSTLRQLKRLCVNEGLSLNEHDLK